MSFFNNKLTIFWLSTLSRSLSRN